MGAPLTLALASGQTPLAPVVSDPWVTPADLIAAGVTNNVDLSSVCTVATELLFILSGRRYGVRTETVRPTMSAMMRGWNDVPMQELWFLRNTDGPRAGIILKSPVQTVVSVIVDGVVLSPSAYTLYENRMLVRLADQATGTSTAWPIHQQLDLATTEVGTFAVTYQWGQPVSIAGRTAAAVLATQLVKYLNGASDCALPDRVTTIARQGVTQTILDPTEFIKLGRTGLYLVDSWLSAVNPFSNRRRPTITGPDSVRLNRETPNVSVSVGGGWGSAQWGDSQWGG